jgi:hypothetical protein
MIIGSFVSIIELVSKICFVVATPGIVLIVDSGIIYDTFTGCCRTCPISDTIGVRIDIDADDDTGVLLDAEEVVITLVPSNDCATASGTGFATLIFAVVPLEKLLVCCISEEEMFVDTFVLEIFSVVEHGNRFQMT